MIRNTSIRSEQKQKAERLANAKFAFAQLRAENTKNYAGKAQRFTGITQTLKYHPLENLTFSRPWYLNLAAQFEHYFLFTDMSDALQMKV